MAMRTVSILQRKWRAGAERRRTLAQFDAARKEIRTRLPRARTVPGKLLIIRMDDIGDYVLFRNHLHMFKGSPRWKDHTITLLGNAAWRPLFDAFDKGSVDRVIWADKSAYLSSSGYRLRLWGRLREEGFATVIAPSRTRPLMLDDASMLAAAPQHAIGSPNTHVHPAWNEVSDALYDELQRPVNERSHEFHFNADFTAGCCGRRFGGSRPHVLAPPHEAGCKPYSLCFLGANTSSKRWPWRRWAEFVRIHEGRGESAILAGHGTREARIADAVVRCTQARSIVGATSLTELVGWIGGARALITNDTMAAHLGVATNRPTVIVANGVNYVRFTDYERARIGNVATVYPAVFERWRGRSGGRNYDYAQAVSADMASIPADVVHRAMEELLFGKEPQVDYALRANT